MKLRSVLASLLSSRSKSRSLLFSGIRALPHLQMLDHQLLLTKQMQPTLRSGCKDRRLLSPKQQELARTYLVLGNHVKSQPPRRRRLVVATLKQEMSKTSIRSFLIFFTGPYMSPDSLEARFFMYFKSPRSDCGKKFMT